MAKEEVGDYVNKYFVSAFQRVGTFRINGQNKQGGNVASYFCTADGRVLHAIAGPVDDVTFLKEARWVVETVKMGELEGLTDFRQWQKHFRDAHLLRLVKNHQNYSLRRYLPPFESSSYTSPITNWMFHRQVAGASRLNNNDKIHWILACHPLPKINRVYRLVFEDILGERISTNPVVTKS